MHLPQAATAGLAGRAPIHTAAAPGDALAGAGA